MVSLSQLGQPPWPADAYAVAITTVVSYACAPVYTYRHDRIISGPEPGYEGGPRDIPVNSLVDVPVISQFWQQRIFLPPNQSTSLPVTYTSLVATRGGIRP